MGFPDNIPTFRMSPHRVSSESDAIELRPQFPFPMNNSEPFDFDPHSALDHPPSFKRARTSDSNHSNALPCPPRMMTQPQPSKGTSHLFFKTRICAKFRAGTCRNGENCNFAHGFDDIRQPPPNWQELVGLRNEEQRLPAGNWDEDQKIIHKMKLCKKYYNGEECPYGDKCSFLHEDPAKFREDSGKFRESSAISIGTTNVSPKSYVDGSNDSDGNRTVLVMSRGNVKSAYWKTKLCTKWETTGHCNFGEDCHFAHGQAELQVPGGRIEAEIARAISNSAKATIPTLPKALSVSANEAPTTYTASLPLPKEEEQGKKHLLRWKGTKKINRIYGDWIDDLPLVHNLPSRVET